LTAAEDVLLPVRGIVAGYELAGYFNMDPPKLSDQAFMTSNPLCPVTGYALTYAEDAIKKDVFQLN
jgi:hypothetical protein